MDKDLMNEDEVFLDQMKDQFVTFYIASVLGMELIKLMHRQMKSKRPDKPAHTDKI
ncbi:MAG: hypothetical protein J4F41_04820 [Alphaproteobacteria bacterium]|nr:hypothetical protein [Alphaproteobacteria bacterium]